MPEGLVPLQHSVAEPALPSLMQHLPPLRSSPAQQSLNEPLLWPAPRQAPQMSEPSRHTVPLQQPSLEEKLLHAEAAGRQHVVVVPSQAPEEQSPASMHCEPTSAGAP